MKRAREESEDGQPQWVRGRLLGQGNFGSVHVAHFPKALRSTEEAFTDFPATAAVKSSLTTKRSAEDFLKLERDLLKRMRDCPYIVKYLGDEETITSDGKRRVSVFMEYATEGSLRTMVEMSEGEGLLESQVRVLTKNILGGLRRIHHEGLVHCDLKLDNILLFGDGEEEEMVAKVADFGLTRSVNALGQLLRGTRAYWAPEIVMYGFQSQASDIWALGLLVFSMLTGELPSEYVGMRPAAVKPPPTLPPGICTDEAADFLKMCFWLDPKTRPTAAELSGHPFICGVYQPPTPNNNDHLSSTSDSDDESNSDSDSDNKSYSDSDDERPQAAKPQPFQFPIPNWPRVLVSQHIR